MENEIQPKTLYSLPQISLSNLHSTGGRQAESHENCLKEWENPQDTLHFTWHKDENLI